MFLCPVTILFHLQGNVILPESVKCVLKTITLFYLYTTNTVLHVEFKCKLPFFAILQSSLVFPLAKEATIHRLNTMPSTSVSESVSE